MEKCQSGPLMRTLGNTMHYCTDGTQLRYEKGEVRVQ